MKATQIDKTLAKALKAITSRAIDRNREEYQFCYLHDEGLVAATDGRVLVQVKVPELIETYGDFIRETGHVVLLSVKEYTLVEVGEMEESECIMAGIRKLIPTLEKFESFNPTSMFNPWGDLNLTGAKKKARIADCMLIKAIMRSGRAFDPDLFKEMGFKDWTEMAVMGNRVCFRDAEEDEWLIVMGMAEGMF